MSKNVGILTFHCADNYGAVLQAYALRKVISSFPNCQAQIINYVPEGYNYPVLSGSTRCLESQREKRKKFNKFLFEHCGVHTPMIHVVSGNEYDVYLTGSDQIWNTDIGEVAADYEYFLPNLQDDAKRIAYSASIGMDFKDIDQNLFQKYLPKFKSISVREKSYTGIISKLSGKKCEYTLDPTLLLNMRDYEKLIEKPSRVEKPFVLYFWYAIGDEDLGSVELVNTLVRKYNLSVKHTILSEKSAARRMLINDGGCMLQDGVGEFLWYIKNAQVIVTNSYHGAIFSTLFHKPFYIYYPEIRKCRQEDLVKLLNLQDRVIQGYVWPNKLNLDIDYGPISLTLNKEKEKSTAYLRNIIETA